MVVGLDDLNCMMVEVHPEESFLLVCIFLCEMFLEKVTREEGWLLLIF